MSIPLPPRVKDISGQQFGDLTVIDFAGHKHGSKQRHALWRCFCRRCNKEKILLAHSLRCGRATSCGCAKYEHAKYLKRSHGMCTTPEYTVWMNMKARCHRQTNPRYFDYGGRGIIVCERWRNSFANFIADIGQRPTKDHSLDRIDVNGPYAPDNCRWATWEEQQSNRRPAGRIDQFTTEELIAELKLRGYSATMSDKITPQTTKSKYPAVTWLANPL